MSIIYINILCDMVLLSGIASRQYRANAEVVLVRNNEVHEKVKVQTLDIHKAD